MDQWLQEENQQLQSDFHPIVLSKYSWHQQYFLLQRGGKKLNWMKEKEENGKDDEDEEKGLTNSFNKG